MKSIRSVYKIGHGPSSSHTVGPYNAALRFGRRHPDADRFRVVLYGSLAFTGAGHGTGKAIQSDCRERRSLWTWRQKTFRIRIPCCLPPLRTGRKLKASACFPWAAAPCGLKMNRMRKNGSSILKRISRRSWKPADRKTKRSLTLSGHAKGRLPGVFIHGMAGHAGRG